MASFQEFGGATKLFAAITAAAGLTVMGFLAVPFVPANEVMFVDSNSHATGTAEFSYNTSTQTLNIVNLNCTGTGCSGGGSGGTGLQMLNNMTTGQIVFGMNTSTGATLAGFTLATSTNRFYLPSNYTMYATSVVAASGTFGTPIPSAITNGATVLAIGNSTNTFSEVNNQNASNGTAASSDFVATADNGSPSSHYIDMGINSSGYNQSSFTITGANGAYLYSQSDALAIGTAANQPLQFFTGGTLAANEYMRITGAGLVGIGTTGPSQKLDVQGTVSSTAMLFGSGTSTGIFAMQTATATTMSVFALNASGTLDIGGNGNITCAGKDCLKTLNISAASCNPPAQSGANSSSLMYVGNNVERVVSFNPLAYSRCQTNEFSMPNSWDGSTLSCIFKNVATTTDANGVTMGIQAQGIGNGGSLGTGFTGPTSTVTFVPTTTNAYTYSTSVTLTVGGSITGTSRSVKFQITRSNVGASTNTSSNVETNCTYGVNKVTD